MKEEIKRPKNHTTRDRLRLLLWGNTFPLVGGIERFIDHLAHGLAERGHEVLVLSEGKRVETLKSSPFEIRTIPMAGPTLDADATKILKAALEARNFVANFSPDVIHYNPSSLEMPIFAMSVMREAFPIVTTIHFDLNNEYLSVSDGVFARIVGASEKVNTVSKYMHSRVPTLPFLSEREIMFIENAVPGDKPFKSAPKGKTILCLGRLVFDKGFDQMVAAMPIILKEHPDAKLLIGGLGPEKAALVKQTEELGVNESVTLTGWIQPEDVHKAMQDANIVVFPSRWEEPFGLVAIEAAIAGRPCVAFDVGGITHNIQPGATGELVPPADVPSLAKCISGLLSDPERAEQLGLNAHKEFGNNNRFNKMLDRYEALYHSVRADQV